MNDESRSAPRVPTRDAIEVNDSITGNPIGRIGNLSRNGMMLVCRRDLNDNALYQLRFRLPATHGNTADIDAGVHVVWTEHAATDGFQWAGARIISISAPAASALDAWLEAAA